MAQEHIISIFGWLVNKWNTLYIEGDLRDSSLKTKQTETPFVEASSTSFHP